MKVIGTAGHVDHGKSTLIEVLTGIQPDRLKEEKAREMTIDLGFGWMTLPDGEPVGIVDVPGHRDFIENMLSGIGGIDAALLIIAADEGVMPQTKEHLAILDLLHIPAGLIVLTKTDLASDPAWIDLVENEIRSAVSQTILKDAPIVRVSAKNRTGLEALKTGLQSLLRNSPARPDLNRPRLPIDRVFSMSGFGTVVTGTLRDGHLSVGDEVEILPGGLRGRIRGLQTHKQTEDIAVPGSRTAVNISGVTIEEIARGAVIAHPDQYQATRRIDAKFRAIEDIRKPLAHGDEVKLFVAASETVAKLRILDTEEINAGGEGWIQLELSKPIVAIRGDRYILRRPSPGETLGGGTIVDHQPKGRHKRFNEKIIESLGSLLQGAPADVLFEAALALQIASVKSMVTLSRLEPVEAESALQELLNAEKIILLDQTGNNDSIAASASYWNTLSSNIQDLVETYHEQFPLRRGIPREELKSRLKLEPKVFNAALSFLASQNSIIDEQGTVSKPGHEIKFTGADRAKVEALRRRFESNPYETPSIKECQAEAGVELVNALIESGELMPVSDAVIFRKEDYDEITARIKSSLAERGNITLAEARDMLGTTRKYAQALLEHLDSTGLTVRDGDTRRLRK